VTFEHKVSQEDRGGILLQNASDIGWAQAVGVAAFRGMPGRSTEVGPME
jgi:hypothetical protein